MLGQTSHASLSEAMRRMEHQLAQARADKTRQQNMYREIVQKLARENRGLRRSLHVSREECEAVAGQIVVRDRKLRELQLELEAAKVTCSALNLLSLRLSKVEARQMRVALSKTKTKVREAVERERAEWQRTSRFNSGQVREARDHCDTLRQQLLREREERGRVVSDSLVKNQSLCSSNSLVDAEEASFVAEESAAVMMTEDYPDPIPSTSPSRSPVTKCV